MKSRIRNLIIILTVILIPTVIILIGLWIWQPWSMVPGAQDLLLKAYAESATISSYSMNYVSSTYFDGNTSDISFESEYAAPDRYRIKMTLNGKDVGGILIGERLVFNNAINTEQPYLGLIMTFANTPHVGLTQETIDALTNVKQLPDEKIDNIDCFHLSGGVDPQKLIEMDKSNSDLSNYDDDELIKIEQKRTQNYNVEVWIGKEDYLIRQIKTNQQAGQGDNISSTVKYSDFNKAFSIEFPLDSSGSLLPGWVEQPNSIFAQSDITTGGSIGTESSEDSHKIINLKYTISNTSLQEIFNVRIIITTSATNNPEKPVPLEAIPSKQVPIDLKPREQETFSLTWKYDPSKLLEEENNLEATTRVLVKYLTFSGQEKEQQIFPYAHNEK